MQDKIMQEIMSNIKAHSKTTGLPIETHIEGIKIYIAERKKGKSFEESVQAGIAFLDEKETAAVTCNNDRRKKNSASAQEAD